MQFILLVSSIFSINYATQFNNDVDQRDSRIFSRRSTFVDQLTQNHGNHNFNSNQATALFVTIC